MEGEKCVFYNFFLSETAEKNRKGGKPRDPATNKKRNRVCISRNKNITTVVADLQVSQNESIHNCHLYATRSNMDEVVRSSIDLQEVGIYLPSAII